MEMPAEAPDSTFPSRVKMAGYPVQDLCGLIFAYLGPEPVPLLPRWDMFVWDNVLRDIGSTIIPCNWLQIMENSLDPVHVEWLHGRFADYVLERLGRAGVEAQILSSGQREAPAWVIAGQTSPAARRTSVWDHETRVVGCPHRSRTRTGASGIRQCSQTSARGQEPPVSGAGRQTARPGMSLGSRAHPQPLGAVRAATRGDSLLHRAAANGTRRGLMRGLSLDKEQGAG